MPLPFLVDKRLVPRVRRVLEDAVTFNRTLTLESVVADLQSRHPEYKRQPRMPFRTNVQTAIDRIKSDDASAAPASASASAAGAAADADNADSIASDVDDDDVGGDATASANVDGGGEGGGGGADADEGGDDSGELAIVQDVAGSGRVAASGASTPLASASTASRARFVGSARTPASLQPGSAKRAMSAGTPLGPGHAGGAAAAGRAAGGPVSSAKRVKAGGASSVAPSAPPPERFADVGGLTQVIQELRELVEYPLLHPEVYEAVGVQPLRGVLLTGPPGCGKTMLAHALAGETGVSFFKVAATEIVSGMSGESEAKIRQLFADAIQHAPSLVFLDEIDSITPKRENATREMERRIVAQLISCFDDVMRESAPVVVLGATNRPDSLDSSLRRAGRFDRELVLGIPDAGAREGILRVMTGKMVVHSDVDYAELARLTPGYVGADLASLIREAGLRAAERVFCSLSEVTLAEEGAKLTLEQRAQVSNYLRGQERIASDKLASYAVTAADFRAALQKVQPSIKREGFTTVPNVTWEDVGALEDVRAEIQNAIVFPIRNPALFDRFGIPTSAGVLLFGPPGCGKTMLAKAVANESGANFIGIKGPELLNKYVGEAERAIRQVFQRARAAAPCVLFFDELDALCPRRSGGDTSSSERVVNQLLTEMDGVESRGSVFVIAATNRPDMIDPAMKRPGRLDKLLFVPLPDGPGRVSILRTLTRRVPLDADVDLQAVGSHVHVDGFSGADLQALVREAGLHAMRAARVSVAQEDFAYALSKVKRSVSLQDADKYAGGDMSLGD